MALSILGKLIEQAVADAKTADLPGLSDAHVVSLGAFSAYTFENHVPGLPAVAIGPFGSEQVPPAEGTNQKDDVTYPILVAIIDAANQNHEFGFLDKRWYWREQLMKEYNFQSFSSVDLGTGNNFMLATVDPFPVIDQTSWENNWWLSGFLVNVKVRQNRP